MPLEYIEAEAAKIEKLALESLGGNKGAANELAVEVHEMLSAVSPQYIAALSKRIEEDRKQHPELPELTIDADKLSLRVADDKQVFLKSGVVTVSENDKLSSAIKQHEVGYPSISYDAVLKWEHRQQQKQFENNNTKTEPKHDSSKPVETLIIEGNLKHRKWSDGNEEFEYPSGEKLRRLAPSRKIEETTEYRNRDGQLLFTEHAVPTRGGALIEHKGTDDSTTWKAQHNADGTVRASFENGRTVNRQKDLTVSQGLIPEYNFTARKLPDGSLCVTYEDKSCWTMDKSGNIKVYGKNGDFVPEGTNAGCAADSHGGTLLDLRDFSPMSDSFAAKTVIARQAREDDNRRKIQAYQQYQQRQQQQQQAR